VLQKNGNKKIEGSPLQWLNMTADQLTCKKVLKIEQTTLYDINFAKSFDHFL